VQAFYSAKVVQGLSPTSVHHSGTVLHTMLEKALRLRLVPRNVSELGELPKIARHEMQTLDAQQAQKLLATAREVDDGRWYALYLMELTTGQRSGEIFGLRWQDVNLPTGQLSCAGGADAQAERLAARIAQDGGLTPSDRAGPVGGGGATRAPRPPGRGLVGGR
jgi:integrase